MIGSNLVGTTTVLTGVIHGLFPGLGCKPIGLHCHLPQYCNTGPSIFHTLLQPGRHRVNTFPQEVSRNGEENSPLCGCSSLSGQTSCLALPLMRQSHGVRMGLLKAVLLVLYTYCSYSGVGDRSSTVGKVLGYTSEGRWFDPSWCQWIFH